MHFQVGGSDVVIAGAAADRRLQQEDTAMTMYGANPEQLTALGRSLQRQIEAIDAMTSSITATLAGTTWTGPARDQFEHDWHTTFRGALDRMKQAFDAAGHDCVRMSADLQRLLGPR